MLTTQRVGTTTLAVVTALALTACTSQSPDDTDAVVTATATAEPDARTPFSPYWDAMYGVYDDSAEIAKREQVEVLIAACMAAEGFDYIPVDQTPDTDAPDAEAYGTAAWVAEHGYGAFPTAESTRQIDEQVAADDPNLEYVAALSEGEQGAYYASLQGAAPDREALIAMKESGEVPAYDWTAAGCQGSAQHDVNGDDPTRSARYTRLIEDMNALAQAQAAHPAMAPIEAEWSGCMADDGYDGLPTRQSAVDAVFAQASAYWDAGAVDDPDPATLAQWRAFEIDIAVADFACAETVGYTDGALAVQVAMENRFIDDNREELDELLAEIAQGG